ncbi:hypothetical protein [Vulcanisaeta souniana]|nr:hypothetical protein [Vulcanisaeta souniana]
MMRVTSWHQQKLSRILDKGIKMGFIIKCVSGEGYDLALPVSRRSLISRG